MNNCQEMREPLKRRCIAGFGQDRISNLPSNVIDQIFSRLKFRDAARTSVLSRKWRYKWAELPYLVLHFYDWSSHTQRKLDSTKVASIVDHVLLLHRCPILKFKVDYILASVDDSAVDSWIMHLSRFPIKELELRIYKFGYCVPSCLFSCQNLTHLFLSHSTIRLPSTFKGFTNLKSLELYNQTISEEELEIMISSCPVLERLNLKTCYNTSHVTISAPNLLYFSIEGDLRSINFKNTSRLADVSILSRYNRDKYLQSFRYNSNLLNFCVQLPMLRNLKTDTFFLKSLAVGVVPGDPPISYTTLDSLTLIIDLNNKEDCSRAACVLSVFPNLLKLIIEQPKQKPSDLDGEFFEETESNIWEENCLYFRFTKLQYVYIKGITRTQGELNFVKFMLSISPVLERLVITPDYKGVDLLKLVNQLLSFRRASRCARVIVPDR